MRKSIYKRIKKNKKKPTEAVKKPSFVDKVKQKVAEESAKAKPDQRTAKRAAAKKRVLAKQDADRKAITSTQKKTRRGLKDTEETKKVRAEQKKKKESARQEQINKSKSRTRARAKKPDSGKTASTASTSSTSSSQSAKAAVGKKKATEAVAEVVAKKKEKRVAPSEKIYTDKEGRKYKKVRSTLSKVRGGGMKYKRKYM